MTFPILSMRPLLDTAMIYDPIQVYTPEPFSYDHLYRREVLQSFAKTIHEIQLRWSEKPSTRTIWELTDEAYESLVYDWYVGGELVKLRYREELQIGRTTFNALFSITSWQQLNRCHDRTIRWVHGGGVLLRHLTLLDPVTR